MFDKVIIIVIKYSEIAVIDDFRYLYKINVF